MHQLAWLKEIQIDYTGEQVDKEKRNLLLEYGEGAKTVRGMCGDTSRLM